MSTQQLSEFGKFVRIARLQSGKTLKDMADFAGVKSAYFSAIETGRKEVTGKVVELVARFLNLDEVQKTELEILANSSNGKIRIDLESMEKEGVEVATLFARYGSQLSHDAMVKISTTIKDEVMSKEK